MAKKRGKELSILFALVAFVVLVNTSLMFVYLERGSGLNMGDEVSPGKVTLTGNAVNLNLDDSEDDSEGLSEEPYSAPVSSSSSSRRSSGSSSSSSSGSSGSGSSSDTSDDTDSSGDSDDDSNDNDSTGKGTFEPGDGDVNNDLDPVPENQDGPEAESVEGKDLEFDFGFGGFG